MSRDQPQDFSDPEALVDQLIQRLGKRIVLAMPLGLGKANHLANALYDRAAADPDLSLTILTALTLEAPTPGSELGRRFLDPIADRFFGRYPALRYAQALRRGNLPANVQVHEFFLMPGRWLNRPPVQQAYQCANYTQVLELLIDSGVNLIGQLVAPPLTAEGDQLSLSCNPDLSVDLLEARARGRIDFIAVAQVNRALPYMKGAAERPLNDFDYRLDDPALEFPLYAPPQQPVTLADHAIGLQVARLMPDGGTLQIGIGSISDAICHALLLRQRHNQAFNHLLDALDVPAAGHQAERGRFHRGLYGVSEMLVEGFLALLEADILKREVDGVRLHAGFFLGSPGFYRRLAALPPALRDKIAMMPISFTNSLHPQSDAKRAARANARFVNSAMMVTLLGATVSDGLEDGRVVSGVGGQYNFAAMGLELPGARSVITLHATRTQAGRTRSNLLWNYGHCTLPRHLRDLVVTEYGVADLRGVSDAEVIKRLLAICDSRFQAPLLEKARAAGKLPEDYRIPEDQRHNTPEALAERLARGQEAGWLPLFPLGSDFSPEEERLTPALQQLGQYRGNSLALLRLALKGLGRGRPGAETQACLERMGLARPRAPREWLYRALLRALLS